MAILAAGGEFLELLAAVGVVVVLTLATVVASDPSDETGDSKTGLPAAATAAAVAAESGTVTVNTDGSANDVALAVDDGLGRRVA